jgi:hypothetical protein
VSIDINSQKVDTAIILTGQPLESLLQRARTAGFAEEQMNLEKRMSKALVRGCLLALALTGVLGLGWAGAQTATSNDFVQADAGRRNLSL